MTCITLYDILNRIRRRAQCDVVVTTTTTTSTTTSTTTTTTTSTTSTTTTTTTMTTTTSTTSTTTTTTVAPSTTTTTTTTTPSCYNSISDDFNRDDETPLGSPYGHFYSSNGSLALSSNEVVLNAGGAGVTTADYVIDDEHELCSTDHCAQVTITGLSITGSDKYMRLHVRANASTGARAGYLVNIAAVGATCDYFLVKWPGWVQFASATGQAGGGVATFKMIADGSTISVERDGVQKVSGTNSDEDTGVHVGFGMQAYNFTSGQMKADNFAAETL